MAALFSAMWRLMIVAEDRAAAAGFSPGKMAAGCNDVESANLDPRTVAGFEEQWSRFRQRELPDDERWRKFDGYFRIFPWHLLPPDGGRGADVGCGTGRWAILVAPRVAERTSWMQALPPSKWRARTLPPNVWFHCASVNAMPFDDGSLDFAYSLGMLHYVPDAAAAVAAVARKLKAGAPFLIYLYKATMPITAPERLEAEQTLRVRSLNWRRV